MKGIICLLLALCCLFSSSFALSEDSLSISLEAYPKVDGSTAFLPLSYALMSKLTGISEEEAKNLIAHTKTTASYYALAYGNADLLIVSEPPQQVLDSLEGWGIQIEKRVIGREGLVFLVNEKNPVTSLTHGQITGIYSGAITNWAEVGGEDREIIAYQRNADAGSQIIMMNKVMNGIPLMEAPTDKAIEDMSGLVDVIANYKNSEDALGYSVYYYVTNMYIQPGIKLLAVDGIAPSTETIASGEYPYTQVFYVVIRKDEPKDSAARKIFNFLGTEEGKKLIQDTGYVYAAEE